MLLMCLGGWCCCCCKMDDKFDFDSVKPKDQELPNKPPLVRHNEFHPTSSRGMRLTSNGRPAVLSSQRSSPAVGYDGYDTTTGPRSEAPHQSQSAPRFQSIDLLTPFYHSIHQQAAAAARLP